MFHGSKVISITFLVVQFVKTERPYEILLLICEFAFVLVELICLRPMCLVFIFKLITFFLLRITANEICTIERFKFKFFSCPLVVDSISSTVRSCRYLVTLDHFTAPPLKTGILDDETWLIVSELCI
jgi:hypothetical protein